MNNKLLSIVAMALCLLAGVSGAQTIDIDVDGNEVEASIEFPLGLQADLLLQFDNAMGLTASSAGISAQLIDPLDTNLIARLPGVDVSALSAFPMMITVEPPSAGGLTFTDTVLVEIHTHALSLTANTPYRLFKAPLGGAFEDITETIGAGSIRSRGRTGGFSQFLILADLRSHSSVIEDKLDDLEALVLDASLSTALEVSLLADIDAARLDATAGDYEGAEDHIDDFSDEVEANAGAGIPNIWRAARDLDNYAGNLIGKASSVRFSLRMAASL